MFSRPAGRGLLRTATKNDGVVSRRMFSSTPARRVDFEHVVIGAGAVGLATARALAMRSSSSSSTLLLERHLAPGTETSSRNSEVIHAGIYYGPLSTLKTSLCIRGKELLYEFCTHHNVPHRNCGKFIVAQTHAQREALEKVYRHCMVNGEKGSGGGDGAQEGGLGGRVPVRWVGEEELKRREPEVRAEAGCLESPTTGIVDSHGLMVALLGGFEDAGGIFAPGSDVVRIEPLGGNDGSSSSKPGSAGWAITTRDFHTSELSTITTSTLVNAAGLGAVAIHNLIAPLEQHKKLYYAKGNYFSYGASSPKVSTLVYPAPEPGLGGLGTHLTLDLAGRLRFGPDVEWVDDPTDLTVNTSRFEAAVRQIKKFLPGVDVAALAPDYAGIRPKLAPGGAVMDGKGFHDFVVRMEEGWAGWVNLLGIESPGLTSCLAIAERVEGLLYK
ncbi:FAD dependent oxidoreductase [Coniella lustricola]|uniref:L-2-hydroxyglutarate dehydrogenase, mitochondrial n=1 Tax=Coniella lustricola TaxID=2025994 RepID=A0A2T3A6B6_9PEZI|nr:FAD dependent oxidoreductase [Coniella lustricola]